MPSRNGTWAGIRKGATGDGKCTTRDPQSHLHHQRGLSPLGGSATGPYALLKGWQDYINGIARHGQHHVDIVLENSDGWSKRSFKLDAVTQRMRPSKPTMKSYSCRNNTIRRPIMEGWKVFSFPYELLPL